MTGVHNLFPTLEIECCELYDTLWLILFLEIVGALVHEGRESRIGELGSDDCRSD